MILLRVQMPDCGSERPQCWHQTLLEATACSSVGSMMTCRWIPVSYKAAGQADLQWTSLTGCATGATMS